MGCIPRLRMSVFVFVTAVYVSTHVGMILEAAAHPQGSPEVWLANRERSNLLPRLNLKTQSKIRSRFKRRLRSKLKPRSLDQSSSLDEKSGFVDHLLSVLETFLRRLLTPVLQTSFLRDPSSHTLARSWKRIDSCVSAATALLT